MGWNKKPGDHFLRLDRFMVFNLIFKARSLGVLKVILDIQKQYYLRDNIKEKWAKFNLDKYLSDKKYLIDLAGWRLAYDPNLRDKLADAVDVSPLNYFSYYLRALFNEGEDPLNEIFLNFFHPFLSRKLAKDFEETNKRTLEQYRDSGKVSKMLLGNFELKLRDITQNKKVGFYIGAEMVDTLLKIKSSTQFRFLLMLLRFTQNYGNSTSNLIGKVPSNLKPLPLTGLLRQAKIRWDNSDTDKLKAQGILIDYLMFQTHRKNRYGIYFLDKKYIYKLNKNIYARELEILDREKIYRENNSVHSEHSEHSEIICEAVYKPNDLIISDELSLELDNFR